MKQCPNCLSQAKDTDLRCPSCGSIVNKSAQSNRNQAFNQDAVPKNRSRIFILAILILLVIVSSTVFYVNSFTPKLSDFGFVQSETDSKQYYAKHGEYTYHLDTERNYLIIESKTEQSIEDYHLPSGENIVLSKMHDTSGDTLDIVCEFYVDHTYSYISSCAYLRVNEEEIFPYRFSQDMKPTVDLIKERTNDVLESFYTYLNNQDIDQIYTSEFLKLDK